MRVIASPDVPKPGSAYAQAVLHDAGAKRLVIAGQVGMAADGTVLEGYEAQAAQAWANIMALLAAAGMGIEHIVSLRAYDVAPGHVALYRAARDAALGGHLVACTYIVVAGLASPAFLTEIEVEAVA
jgi:2-iminobutanoate/2-iminopropanoate deaminase